jgi:hypothetical protein
MSDPFIGFLIGFDFLPTIRDKGEPDYLTKYREEFETIQKGIKFTSLSDTLLRPINDEDNKKIEKFLPKSVINGELPVSRVGKFVLESPEPILDQIITSFRIIKKGDVRLSHIIRSKILIHYPLPFVSASTKGLMYNFNFNELLELETIASNIIRYDKIDDEQYNRLRTALTWFNKSYEEHYGRIQFNRLIDLVICSEALFLDNKGYRNAGPIIGIACSLLIGKDFYERNKIKKAFENAYFIRNKEVHGGNISKENPEIRKILKDMNTFNEEISSYLRSSLRKLLS